MFNKAYKVAQFHYVEVQACKFDEGFKIAYADIGRRGFMFTLLGVTLWVRWNCDHPGASFEMLSPWGHAVELQFYDTRHKDE
jgi:hypothetical protein